MSGERYFPVMLSFRERKSGGNPLVVPWSLVADHEAQAMANHRQTLERLAQRGGLDPVELWCVVHDLPWSKRLRDREAVLTWLRCVA